MKRLIIIIVLVIVLFFGYGIVTQGLTIDALNIEISGYEDMESASDDLTLEVANYNKLNTTTYQTTLTALTTAVNEYNSAKEEYEELIEEIADEEEILTDIENDETVVGYAITVYEIDFLWTKIGNYAKSEGLTLTMSVSSASETSSVIGYGLYNLSFNVTGEYINIADFLYDIEDDDELGFEIRDFSMISGQASFTVYNVPMNSDTLIESTESTELTEEVLDSTNTTNETSTGNTTTTTNTTNTTNTTTDTNTVTN